MFQIALSGNHPFIRTPKGFQFTAEKRTYFQYRLPFDWIVLIELLLAAYSATGLLLCLLNHNIGPLFFFLTCTLGFGYVAWMTIKERL